MTAVPITGDVLTWAREFRGLSQEAAADLMDITVADLQDYEKELRKPTLTMFERFATRYALPQATLFLAKRPEVNNTPVDFRSVDGKKSLKQSFDFHAALAYARTNLFHYVKAASDDEEFVAPKLPQLSLTDDPEAAGERARRDFGISAETQLGWPSAKGFRNWRASFESKGVLVFQEKFPIEDCRGFSLYEDLAAPCIVVNKAETTGGARTFTLVHEYCHLLLRQPGISDLNNANATEAFCNRFAAAFLMPVDALRLLLPIWPNEPVDWEEKKIKWWAARLKVSQRALALRLEHLGVAPIGFNKKFHWHHISNAKPPKKGQQVDQVAIRLSEVGSAFVERIIGALDRRQIDSVQAVEALGIGTDSIPKAREYLAARRDGIIAA